MTETKFMATNDQVLKFCQVRFPDSSVYSCATDAVKKFWNVFRTE